MFSVASAEASFADSRLTASASVAIASRRGGSAVPARFSRDGGVPARRPPGCARHDLCDRSVRGRELGLRTREPEPGGLQRLARCELVGSGAVGVGRRMPPDSDEEQGAEDAAEQERRDEQHDDRARRGRRRRQRQAPAHTPERPSSDHRDLRHVHSKPFVPESRSPARRYRRGMRHAILGAGGIGGLVGAALAQSGADVVLLMRPETLAGYDGRLTVESAVLGDFDVDVPAASGLERRVDVLWVTPKATALSSALELGPAPELVEGAAIPLLNGVDHLATVRARYPNTVAGAIRVESERVAPGRIRQSSPFLRVELADREDVASELRAAGIDARVRADEISLLWDKLAFLAPVALATAALDGPLGAVRDDARYLRCQDEAIAVARASGADIDEAALRALQQAAPAEMRSSMQKDVSAGLRPELDAIAGPIIRGGENTGFRCPRRTSSYASSASG